MALYNIVAGNVTINNGVESYTPNDTTNAAKALYLLLKQSQQSNTAPSATVTPPSFPSSGPMFTITNSTLASAASIGDTSLVLTSVGGLAAGSSIQFSDNSEKVVVAPTYVSGNTTVPLKTALIASHIVGASLSYFTSALIPGSTSVNPSAPIPQSAQKQQNQALANLANAYAQWIVNDVINDPVFTQTTTDGSTVYNLTTITVPQGFAVGVTYELQASITSGAHSGQLFIAKAFTVLKNVSGTVGGSTGTKTNVLQSIDETSAFITGSELSASFSNSIATLTITGHASTNINWSFCIKDLTFMGL